MLPSAISAATASSQDENTSTSIDRWVLATASALVDSTLAAFAELKSIDMIPLHFPAWKAHQAVAIAARAMMIVATSSMRSDAPRISCSSPLDLAIAYWLSTVSRSSNQLAVNFSTPSRSSVVTTLS